MKQIDSGQDRVTKNGTFIFPKDQELNGEEIIAFIGYNETVLNEQYRKNMNAYLGKHSILSEPNQKADNINSKIVDNSFAEKAVE